MSVRRFASVARVTARELLCEPLCLLVTLSSAALVALAPAIHCHQFGDPTRMARDAGFSALLLGGLFYAVFGALKSCRRDVESGTMALALAHSVTRTGFFLAKCSGAFIAYIVFALTLAAVTVTIVTGAEIGGRLASATGGLARLWGPSLALSLAVPIVSLVVAAALNRFARWRFVRTAHLLALIFALAGGVYRFDAVLAGRILPVALLFALPPLLMLVAASAFAMRFPLPVVTSLTTLVVLAFVPALGNYCLSDALAKGGVLSPRYVAFACAALVPALAAFLSLGSIFIHGREAA